ncbi:MAG: phenylalanine--tRNA ligase beta subunit-related protein [Gemmataceae bacterium]
MVTTDPHPLLDLAAFVTTFPRSLGEMAVPDTLLGLLRLDAAAPFTPEDRVREQIRALLRHGGYKPTGRGKPASEYLLRAAGDGSLATINLAVDACNAVSLHSGLPISVIDLDRAAEPLRVGLAPPGTSYVFNAAGQSIDLAGLLCLSDAAGPCANGVKDAQRTKTTPQTRRTLSLVWGTNALPGRTAVASAWYQELLRLAGAVTAAV